MVEASDLGWAPAGALDARTRAAATLADATVAATAAGLARTEDGGETWSPVAADGLPTGAVTGLFAVGEDALLAWVHGKGAYRSADGGASWAEIPGPPTQELLTQLLNPRGRVVPRDVEQAEDGTLWMAALGGVFTSADGGETWQGVDMALPGAFNVLFTDVAVRGDTVWAVSQLADSMLPSSYAGLLAGTLFVSEDGGATWAEVGDRLDAAYPTAVALSADGATVCVGSMDQGTWCGDGQRFADVGGPPDPIRLAFSGDDLLATSASMGPARWDGAAWTGAPEAGPMAALTESLALGVDGRAWALAAGAGAPLPEEGDGAVHIALSFHVNLYHSYRGDSNDEDGYGKDLRVLRTILDWLDAHPEVRADWDIENHFSLDGWLATEGPDIVARIQERVDRGQDDVRIMSWNNGAMASSTREEFDAAVVGAQQSGLATFGRMVPGVQPQECMFTPDHIGWYAARDIDWITLFYSATGFTGPRLDVDLSGAALHNPVTLRDPQTDATLTWVPAYHHADVLDHGGLRGWSRQLRRSAEGDSLLLIHFDGDGESWERFDQELDAVADLADTGAVRWTTIQGYLDDHAPVATVDATWEVADGVGDGFGSWAEKDLNHELATGIAQARDAAEQAAFLAEGDLDLEALVEDALEPRLLALSTTHFGLAAPYLADDRVASARAHTEAARAAGQDAQMAATDAWMADHPVRAGTLVLLNPRDSAGTALVEAEVRVPKDEWEGDAGLALFDPEGEELVVHVGPPRSSDRDWVVPITFALPVEAEAVTTLTWTHQAEGERATGGLDEADVTGHPLYARLGSPITACAGVEAPADLAGEPAAVTDPRTSRGVSGIEWRVPLCDDNSTVLVDRSVYAGLPGLVVRVEARMGEPTAPEEAETIALTPLQCEGPAESITWQTFGGTVRQRPVRPGVETWNGQSADGWVALACADGGTIQVSHRVGLRTSLAFAPFSEQDGKAMLAPLGTIWGDSPWHDAPRTGGTGLGDAITSLVGSQFRPAAPDWAGRQIRYQLLLGEDLDEGTLDLFAHPPLVLVGEAP